MDQNGDFRTSTVTLDSVIEFEAPVPVPTGNNSNKLRGESESLARWSDELFEQGFECIYSLQVGGIECPIVCVFRMGRVVPTC